MKNSTTRTDLPAALRVLIPLLFWISVWWILALAVNKAVLLPSPWDVVCVFARLITEGAYWLSVISSIFRVLLGYAAGCIVGLGLAAICFRSQIADALLSPVLSIVRAVPVASFIILALVWIGRQSVPAFIAFLMVLPIITGNVRAGLNCIDRDLAEVAVLYRFSALKTVRHLYYPAVRPHFIAGAQTSLGLAWKAGVAAEVLCSLKSSIGGNIYASKLYLETDSLFAWTITVIAISMLIEKVLFRRKAGAAA